MARTMVLEDFPHSEAYRKKLVARPMMQLDDDIMEAMKKFERMEEVLCSLPGLDCGACGAPSCQGLAEDIVQGKAHEIDCILNCVPVYINCHRACWSWLSRYLFIMSRQK